MQNNIINYFKIYKAMSNNVIDEFQKILRGKNGTIFFVILAIAAVMFFFNVIPALIKFLVVGGIVFLIFRYFENKNKE